MRGWVMGDRDAIDRADMRPRVRLRRSSVRRRWPLQLALVGLAAGGVVAMAAPREDGIAPAVADTPPPTVATAPAWLDIVKPVEMFGVSAVEFDKLPRTYFARRHRAGGGRQDYLSLGTPDGLGPYLRLAIYRVGSEATSDVSLFVDVARRAADASLGIRKSGAPYLVATRFGRFEATDLELDSDVVPACTGVRLDVSPPNLRIAGLACGTRPEAAHAGSADLPAFDRIDLNAAGEDVALARFFAASELARDPACTGAAMVPTPLHAPWLDDKPAAPVRQQAAKTAAKTRPNQTTPKPL